MRGWPTVHPNRVQTTIRLPRHLNDALTRVAREAGVSRSMMLAAMIEAFLADTQLDAERAVAEAFNRTALWGEE